MTPARSLLAGGLLLSVLAVTAVASTALLSGLRQPEPVLLYDVAHLAGAVPTAPAPPTNARRPAPAPSVDAAWLREVAEATGLPGPAVRAYAVASIRLAADQPACRLGWTTLAGVGEVESAHGTVGGRTLDATGRPSRPIIGPALDGRGPVAAIRATDDAAALHGDLQWDHAVGPLQFLPSTWAQWGADGDHDGLVDPQDLDDAAYAAGRYLCAEGGDLSHGADWQAAVYSYNHAASYVAAVYAAATRFFSLS
jgi:membrane-bound lytic murein transglycosylase B